MSAMDAEDFGTRALLMLVRSGADIPQETINSGMAGLVSLITAKVSGAGLEGGDVALEMSAATSLLLKTLSGVSIEELRPLKEELLRGIVFVPDLANPAITVPYPTFKTQIEEAITFWTLQKEALAVNLGFSFPAVASNSTTTGQKAPLRNTPISRARLAR